MEHFFGWLKSSSRMCPLPVFRTSHSLFTEGQSEKAWALMLYERHGTEAQMAVKIIVLVKALYMMT